MKKSFTGKCPVQQNDYTISITYIDTSDLESPSYEKGIATCDYVKYGGKCEVECPIIKSAPENL